MSFFARLTERVMEVDSLLCVGLDPHPADLSAPSTEAVLDFCLKLIRATSGVAAAYKPNIAFFEAFGAAGISTLQQVISFIPDGIPVILDAKRGDIASTAEAYRKAVFETLGADAVTINPYLGQDAVEPFLADPERGVFLLCKTSNPGAADLQDVRLVNSAEKHALDSLTLYEKVALLAGEWNTQDNLGLVVGATQPEALKKVRRRVPEMWILVPGVGSQGGDLENALQAGLRSDGLGLLFPVSRGISRSADPKKAAEEYQQSINLTRKSIQAKTLDASLSHKASESAAGFEQLADGLLETGCIKFGQFTLKSGLISPIYIDLRQLISFPGLLQQVADAYSPILKKLSFDRLGGLPYAALPIASVIAIQAGWPMIYPRKEVKSYGTRAEIEGIFNPGEHIVIIDDLATTGGSKFEAIEKLTSAGLVVEDVVVLIDRQSGAAKALADRGYRLHSVTTLSQLLDYYELNGGVPAMEIASARRFLEQTR